MSYIALSIEDLQKLSSEARKEVFNLLGYAEHFEDEDEDETGGELTKKQIVNFLSGMSEKSKNVLKTMIMSFDGNKISEIALMEELGMVGESLTGVWAGITKRARTVSGDQDLFLINWSYDEASNDNIGRFNPNTYEHLKKIFAV
jgi:hypothetical protein